MHRIVFILISLVVFSTGIFAQEVWETRKDWPDNFPRPPLTEKHLFFLQRNLNSNTIVYDVNISSNGKVNVNEPMEVYWLRYNSTGAKQELSWFQEQFGFGYSAKKNKSEDEYSIKLVAYGDRRIDLKKMSDGKYKACIKINGKICQLTNIYVYADESGIMPDVEHVDIFGKDLDTGKPVFERILN